MAKNINIPKKYLLEMYYLILKIRKVQLEIEKLYHLDQMKTPVHLCLGQEAIAAGVCVNLKKEDYVSSNHRGHGHYIAKGGDLKAMVAELYCKETGCSRGRGGSMHLIDTSVGLLGSSSIVGGGIPIAVGEALGIALQKEKRVSVVFFGDAASEEGSLYESMNFAALKKLPVIFVCENNFYSVCSHIDSRQANGDISMRPKAFKIPAYRIDGTDALDVCRKAKEAIDRARRGDGPSFLECRAYRWCGHSGSGDEHKDKYRKASEWREWIKKDPLVILQKQLIKSGALKQDLIKAFNKDIDDQVAEAFQFAEDSPLPKPDQLKKYLYHGE